MRAIVVDAFGGPEVMRMQACPAPSPGAGEMVVDVGYSDVGTLDRLVRTGWGQDFFDVQPPYVPGDGVGGVVSAIGAGVEESWIGRRVVGGTGPRGADGLSTAPTGGYTDTAVIDERAAVAVPDAVELALATALLNDGPTSQQLIDVGRPGRDDVVLVLAAAGGAGILIVQLAAALQATVVAAAHGPTKVAALRDLGVDHVVDYADPGWTDEVLSLAPGGPSVVFDGAGSRLGVEGLGIAARGARFVSIGTSAGEFAQPDQALVSSRGIEVTGLVDLPPLTATARNRLVVRAIDAARAGVAVPRVRFLPLDEAPRAHQDLEDRVAVGKTLLVSRPEVR